jgi:hypothetical protein
MDIEDFCLKMSRKSKFGQNQTNNSGTWHVLLLPATEILHKIAPFEWNGYQAVRIAEEV